MIEIANTVKKYRKLHGIPSKKLSILLGKSDSYISHLENGRNKNPDYQTVKLIFKELEVPEEDQNAILEELLTRQENQCSTEKFIDFKNNKKQYLTDADISGLLRKEAERIAVNLVGLNVHSKKILIELLNEQLDM